jgi:predicted dehydrogenase
LQLELWRGTMTLIDFADRRTEFPPLTENEIYPGQSPALNFVDAILGKTPNGSPGELGLVSMEIIEAACESAQTNRCEKIRDVKRTTDKKTAANKPAAVRENA